MSQVPFPRHNPLVTADDLGLAEPGSFDGQHLLAWAEVLQHRSHGGLGQGRAPHHKYQAKNASSPFV